VPAAPARPSIARSRTNSYLVEDEDRLTLVDAGLPATHRYLLQALAAIGRRPEDIVALVITHAHFDHVGTAARLREELGCRVLVHDEDASLAEHPYRYLHERPRIRYPLRYPAALPALASMTAAGALWVRGTTRTEALPGSGTLDVPGAPNVVFTPGHTFGHCALVFPTGVPSSRATRSSPWTRTPARPDRGWSPGRRRRTRGSRSNRSTPSRRSARGPSCPAMVGPGVATSARPSRQPIVPGSPEAHRRISAQPIEPTSPGRRPSPTDTGKERTMTTTGPQDNPQNHDLIDDDAGVDKPSQAEGSEDQVPDAAEPDGDDAVG
jgi:hypothetical protein